MRIAQVLFPAAVLVASASVFAHDGKTGPCHSYMESCKTDAAVTAATDKKDKWKAMETCVKTAATADTANGKACLDEQAKHMHK
jgi:hypothetical protein